MKLNQVIASFMTEITKAQANADAYAKEIKEYYKEDAYLRLLTAPRVTVKEVKLDLKYAILETEQVYKWIFVLESNLSLWSIYIRSVDNGKSFQGQVGLIAESNIGPINLSVFKAENSDGNNYEVQIGDRNDTWVIGDRANQRVVELRLTTQNGNLEGTVIYNGEDPIEITCFKADESEGNNVYIINYNYNNILSTDNEVEVEVLTENLKNYSESTLSSISITLDMDNA